MSGVVNKRRKEIADWVATRKATAADAAIEFGVSPITIETACRLNKVTPSPTPRRNTSVSSASTFKILKQMIDGEKSLSDIAREANVSRQRVDQIKSKAIKAGFQLHKRVYE